MITHHPGFNHKVINGPGIVNPMPSMPAEQFGRSLDVVGDDSGGGGGGGTITTADWPLKLVAVDTENVKVLLGTVNGGTPTDINTNIDVSGSSTTWAIYMHVSISGTTASSPEVLSNSAGTVPSDTTTDSYRLIGEVDVSGSVITEVRPSMAWSQAVVVCTADTPPYVWMTGA